MFDQKIMPCPMLQAEVVYYKRQRAIYKLTLYETSTEGNKVHSKIWDETIAGRSGKEIGANKVAEDDGNEVLSR